MTDKLLHPPCVMCGVCCATGPCPYGIWDADRKQCSSLGEPNELGQRGCLKYEEILDRPGSEFSPAFGGGCSSSLFNPYRWEIIEKLRRAMKKKAEKVSINAS